MFITANLAWYGAPHGPAWPWPCSTHARSLPSLPAHLCGGSPLQVVDALRQKFKYSSPEVFQMLVVEEAAAPGQEADEDDLQDRLELGPGGSSSGAAPVGQAAGDDERASSHRAASSSGSGSSGASTQAGQASLRRGVLGVVEVSRVALKEVLSRLPPSVEEYVYVSSMAVERGMRRQGVAHALLQAAEEQARMWSAGHLTLHVHKDNAAAVELYRGFGYSVVSEDPGWKTLVGDRVRVLMYKQIALDSSNQSDVEDADAP